MTLKEYAMKLREELNKNPSPEKAKEIADRISKTTVDGRAITDAEINNVLRWIENPTYNPATGQMIECEADNSAFLNLVNVVKQSINQNKGK